MNTWNWKKIQWRVIGGLASFLFLIFLFVPVSIASAQTEAERTAKLVEGAKKEGKIWYYHTSPVDVGVNFLRKFQEKYPFIEFETYRSGDANLMSKILAEVQAKRYLFDVVNTTGISTELLKRKGIFARYLSPQRQFYGEDSKDTEGYWTDIFVNIKTIAYNTKLVSPKEVPKTWNDLLDPKWKGKMGADTKDFEWFAHMLKVMGEKEGLEFMEKLSRQNLDFRTGKTLNCQIAAAGEASIVFPIYNYMPEFMKSRGASIDWAALDPVVSELHPLSVSAYAPHPNAARLFVDFLLSREGQEIMASTFRIPTRIDVDAAVPKLKKGFKIMPFDFSIIDNYNTYIKQYREILMKR